MNDKGEKVDSFCKWYFKQGWEKPLSASFHLFVFVAVVGILIYAATRNPRALEFWRSFVRDPFFWLTWLTLFLSYVDLSYMRYRLQRSGYQNEALGRLFKEQDEIPKQYRKVFGEDTFLRLWTRRWVFLVFAFISGVRYIFR